LHGILLQEIECKALQWELNHVDGDDVDPQVMYLLQVFHFVTCRKSKLFKVKIAIQGKVYFNILKWKIVTP